MDRETLQERIRAHRAAQGKRELEIPEWGLEGEDAVTVKPMSCETRGNYLDRASKSNYKAMLWLVAKEARDKDGKQLFSEVFLRNEADPKVIERIFRFIAEPFLDEDGGTEGNLDMTGETDS